MFPSKDAQDMADAFRAGSSLSNTVVTWIDSSATREHILSRILPGRCSPTIRSGSTSPENGFRYGRGESSYMALAGTQAANLQAGSLSSDELLRWVKALKAKQVFVLIDACYSGLDLLHRGISTNADYLAAIERRGGRLFLAAGQADQLGFEDPKLGHGIFTYHLLQGLAGKGDLNGDGYVTALELANYVTAEVASHSAVQVPYSAAIDGAGDLIVAEVSAR